jgi:hypothetical protein
MLDLILGRFYDDVYAIGRVTEHQVLPPVNFSEMAVLSKLWIAYIHLPDSGNKDEYLTNILLSHMAGVRSKSNFYGPEACLPVPKSVLTRVTKKCLSGNPSFLLGSGKWM